MTVPRILVVGAEMYNDCTTIERVLEHSCITLRAASGSTPILVTMQRSRADVVAVLWWRARHMLVEPPVWFRSKYQHINSLVSSAPDLMLVFGSDKVTKRAVEGARRGQIRVVQIAETEDAEP